MRTVLEIAAAWAALDVVLVIGWHCAHGPGRRRDLVGAPAIATGPRPTRRTSREPSVAGPRGRVGARAATARSQASTRPAHLVLVHNA